MKPTLLYDGNCRFCRFSARAVLRLDRDRELALLPFGDVEAQPLLAAIPEVERHATWHLVREDRRTSGGAALAELVGLLPVTRRTAPALRRLPLAGLYDVVASRRGRLGRLVPDGPAPRRRG